MSPMFPIRQFRKRTPLPLRGIVPLPKKELKHADQAEYRTFAARHFSFSGVNQLYITFWRLSLHVQSTFTTSATQRTHIQDEWTRTRTAFRDAAAARRYKKHAKHIAYMFCAVTDDSTAGQEPDPATKSRAVPIYATTVSPRHHSVRKQARTKLDLLHSRSPSMTPHMERGCLASKSLATSTVGS